VRDQVSHPYRTTGKIIFLYILIFKLLENCGIWLYRVGRSGSSDLMYGDLYGHQTAVRLVARDAVPIKQPLKWQSSSGTSSCCLLTAFHSAGWGVRPLLGSQLSASQNLSSCSSYVSVAMGLISYAQGQLYSFSFFIFHTCCSLLFLLISYLLLFFFFCSSPFYFIFSSDYSYHPRNLLFHRFSSLFSSSLLQPLSFFCLTFPSLYFLPSLISSSSHFPSPFRCKPYYAICSLPHVEFICSWTVVYQDTQRKKSTDSHAVVRLFMEIL
jgi:hypothetical protein